MARRRRRGRWSKVFAKVFGLTALAALAGGAFLMAVVVWRLDSPPSLVREETLSKVPPELAESRRVAEPDVLVRAGEREDEKSIPSIGADPERELRERGLLLPVRGIGADDLRNSFRHPRGWRRHEAIDILAPRGTPVLAVEDGSIARLFSSRAGGLTIYHFDPTARFAYYYAHLDRYADNLREGDQLRRGQVIGYVGTSGNAPPETPHLHFAIFRLTAERQWWKGAPLNPYGVFAGSKAAAH